jgi:cellulose synthase/poly-beta-1,6-N-acetylglucosamine synthase-like glycosyltransferase
LTRIISHEEAVRYKAYICGKDVLGLFIPLTGSCYFVRKSVIEEIGGWDNESLSEDTEMAAKLLERGFQTRFAPDVVSWQESPASFKQLFRQRLRWFRGCMEVALHYGRLLVKKPNVIGIDAEMTLIGPYMAPLCLVSYVVTGYTLLGGVKLDFFSTLFLYGISVLSMVSLLVVGLALAFTAKPRKTSNLLCLPLIYLYWSLQIIVSVVALLQILLRRQRKWLKTVKSGVVIRRASK